MALVAELAHVVVLDDPGADPGRPPEQGQAPLERHDDAARELVAGRHVGQPRALRGGREPGRIEPARVHRHAQEAGADRLEGNGGAGIVRLLHHRAVAGIEQHARDQVQRLLRPVHHDDAIRVAHHAARPAEVLAERRAQRAVAGGRAVPERVGGGAPRVSGRGAAARSRAGTRPPRAGRSGSRSGARGAGRAEARARGRAARSGDARRRTPARDAPPRGGRAPRQPAAAPRPPRRSRTGGGSPGSPPPRAARRPASRCCARRRGLSPARAWKGPWSPVRGPRPGSWS